MATGSARNSSLECPICATIFKEPRSLPCGHSYCTYPCLLRLIGGKRYVKCALCNKQSTVPDGDVKNFPLIYSLDSASQEYQTAIKTKPPPSPATRCTQHVDKPADLFCQTCRVVVCSVCISACHFKHPLVTIEVAAEQEAANLRSLLERTQKHEKLLKELQKDRKTSVVHTRRNGEAQLERVRDKLSYLVEMLLSMQETLTRSMAITVQSAIREIGPDTDEAVEDCRVLINDLQNSIKALDFPKMVLRREYFRDKADRIEAASQHKPAAPPDIVENAALLLELERIEKQVKALQSKVDRDEFSFFVQLGPDEEEHDNASDLLSLRSQAVSSAIRLQASRAAAQNVRRSVSKMIPATRSPVLVASNSNAVGRHDVKSYAKHTASSSSRSRRASVSSVHSLRDSSIEQRNIHFQFFH